jgi:WD40 repeat protein
MCGHLDYVHSAFYNKDGNTIVSASKDGTIKVWGIPSLQQLLDETKRRFSKRELTLDERRKYYLE